MNLDLRSSSHYDCCPNNVEKPNSNYELSATSVTASLYSSVTSFNDSQLLDANTPAPTMESLLADHPWQDSHLNTRGRLSKGSSQPPPGANPIDHLNSSISESLNVLNSSISEDVEEFSSSESDAFSLLPMTRINNNNNLNDSLASLNINDLALNISDHSNAENHQHNDQHHNSSSRQHGSMRRSARRFQNYNSSSKRCHDSSMDLLLEEDDGNQEIIRLLQQQAEVLKAQLHKEQETNVTNFHSMSMQQLPKLISPYERSSSNLMCYHASSPALMNTTTAEDTAELRKKLHGSVRSLKASFKERRYQAQQQVLHQSLQQLETNLAATEREETQLETQLQLTKTQLEQRTRQLADRIAQLEGKLDGATTSSSE